MKMIRIREVCEKTALGKSTVWQKVKDGEFPKPVKLGTRIAVWEETQIDDWLAKKMAANQT